MKTLIYSTLFLFLAFPLASLSFDEAVKMAVWQNTTLIQNNLERENSQRSLAIRYREFFPDMEIGYSQNDSITLGSPDSRVDRISLGIDQLLFSGGRELAAMRMAKRELEIADLSALSLKQSILHQLTVGFVKVLKNRRILDIRNQALENLRLQIDIAEMEYDLGEIRRVDLLDIRLRFSEYMLTMDQAEDDLLQSRYELSRILNIPLDQMSEPVGRLNEDYKGRFRNEIEDINFIPALEAEAERNNHDLVNGRFQEMQAYNSLKDSRFAWLPRIEASADFSMSGQEYPLNEPAFTLGLNLDFDLPLLPSTLKMQSGQKNPEEYNRSFSTSSSILDNLEGAGDIVTAENNLTIHRMNLENSRSNISFQITSGVRELGRTMKRIDLVKESLELQEEKLLIQEQQLSVGEITRLDLIESKIDFADSRIEYLESLVTLHSMEEKLISLSGRTLESGKQESLIYE